VSRYSFLTAYLADPAPQNTRDHGDSAPAATGFNLFSLTKPTYRYQLYQILFFKRGCHIGANKPRGNSINGNSNEIPGRSDPRNSEAVQEVIGKLSVSEGGRLPKSMTASNGVPVTIRWHSSNSSLYSVSGRVNKQFYGGGSKGATLTATATAGSNTAEKTFSVSVPTESAHEMLVRAASNIYVPEDGENLPSSVRVNVNKGTIDILTNKLEQDHKNLKQARSAKTIF